MRLIHSQTLAFHEFSPRQSSFFPTFGLSAALHMTPVKSTLQARVLASPASPLALEFCLTFEDSRLSTDLHNIESYF
jgi:hypothetical protein